MASTGEESNSNCGRCCEKPSDVECADCGRNGGKNGPIPLCSECSDLLHVGFMKDHCLETNDVKEKRRVFKEDLKNYLKKEQVLKRSLVEIKHAHQNIGSRSENNKYTVQQALVAIKQVLKKKEEELASCIADGGTNIKAQLVNTQEDLEKRLQKLQSCHQNAEKILAQDASKFMAEHSTISEEIENILAEETLSDIPLLNAPLPADALDTAKVLDSLQSFGSEWLASQKSGDRTLFTDKLETIKPGDCVKGYVESRMDARGCFWLCQDMLEGIANCLDDLSFEIRKDIISQGWEDLTVKEGSLCVAQYHQDNRWYRGVVEKLFENTAEVRWLDYAHVNEVQLSHIQPLREKFMNIPFQGISCAIFEDLSEEMPRQARWVFSDLTCNLLCECTVIKKLEVGKIPVYLVELHHAGEEKEDIAEIVWNKAQDSRSSKGPIAYRDVRLQHAEAKDIKVVKEVVNASKKSSVETTDSTNKDEDEEEPQADEQDQVEEETVDGAGNGEKTGEGEEEENGGKEEDGGKDAREGLEDLNLAQKLEKQGDSAPAQIDSVSGGTRMSPMAFIAAHGTYESTKLAPYASHSQPQLEVWYRHYGNQYYVPSIGTPSGANTFPLVPGLPANGEAYGIVPGSQIGIHIATPLTADGTFWAAKVRGHEEEMRFRRLMEEISMPSDRLSLDQLHRGKLVCAFASNVDHWCRAKVEEVNNDTVHVRLCDFGSAASLDCTQLKALDVKHGIFQCQAFECSLVKANLRSFSEGSRQLFHQLTTDNKGGKLATAIVGAVVSDIVYVSLFLRGDSGETIDVVAELAKNEDATKGEGKDTGSASSSQGTMSNGQARQTSTGFSSLLIDAYRNSPQFVQDVEREFANLIASLNDSNVSSQTYTFPPLSADQRAFIHELAVSYSLLSESRGQEPSRLITVTAQRGRSSLPSRILSEAYQGDARSGDARSGDARSGDARTVPSLMEEQASDRDHRYMGGSARDDRGCFTCGEMGHRKSNCPKNARNRDRGKASNWWGGDGGRKGRKGGGGGRRN